MAQRSQGNEGTLLERESELGELERLVEDACAGHGRLALIEGPAGIGKTELLAELARRARHRGLLTLSARASELDRDFPFGVIRQLFEPLLGGADDSERARVLRGAAANAAPLFGIAGSGPGASGASASLTYFHALHWLIANAAEPAPLVLVIDDAHWADVSSLRFLEFMLPRVDEYPVLIAASARLRESGTGAGPIDALAADRITSVVRPRPLSQSALAQLTARFLSQAPDPEFADVCHGATGGNPFLAIELLRELEAEGVSAVAEQAAVVRQLAPAAISRAVLVRLTRLGDDASALARAVSVLGAAVPLRHAALLAGFPQERAAELAGGLANAGVLSPERPLDFLHPILREAVYADLGPAERDRAHRQAAGLLADEGAGDEHVAVHLLATEPRGDPDTVAKLRSAATIALGRGSVPTAVDCLRRALQEPPPAAERGAALLALGSAELHAGDPAAAVEHFEAALRLPIDPRARAASMREHGLALAACGRLQDAFTLAEATVADLAEVGQELALEAEAALVALSPFDWSRVPWVRERLERYRGELSGETRTGRMLLATQAWSDAFYGDHPAESLADTAERALASGRLLEDTGGELPPFFFAIVVLVLADRLEAAHRELDRAIAMARGNGSAPLFALASGHRCWALAREGRLAQAEADGLIAAELALEGGWFHAAPGVLGLILSMLIDRGELEQSQQLLDRSGMAAREPDDNPTFDLVVAARARLRSLTGDLNRAHADFAALAARDYRWNTLEMNRPMILSAPELVAGHFEQEAVQVERAQLDAHGWGTPRAIGVALRASALVEGGERGIKLLAESVEALESSPARLEHARALADLGAALRRVNRRVDARKKLREALDLADACGARPLADRVRRELRATGGRPRRPRMTGIDALTPSERRVAEMAADGLSNAEIAQALFITKKTVESHLAGTYSKLDIRSRTQLPVALREG